MSTESKSPLNYRYTIDVGELEYARLMQIVMKYGTSTGEGGSTPITLRLALADAKVRSASATIWPTSTGFLEKLDQEDEEDA